MGATAKVAANFGMVSLYSSRPRLLPGCKCCLSSLVLRGKSAVLTTAVLVSCLHADHKCCHAKEDDEEQEAAEDVEKG